MNPDMQRSWKEQQEIPKTADPARELWKEEGKTQINMFLWRWLPANVTIGDAERLACELHKKIDSIWSPEDYK